MVNDRGFECPDSLFLLCKRQYFMYNTLIVSMLYEETCMRKDYSQYSPLQYSIYHKHIDARAAEYVSFPCTLSGEIQDYLRSRGIDKLYSHQAEMFEQAALGKNIVITTSTASGKTLSFLLPVIQEILRNPSTRAIFLYPTKALASDQMRAIESVIAFFGSSRISAGVYDGDTPPNERQRIRRSANIILTNPDMLNSAFLPNHSGAGFSFLFSNLKYVVIDELHTYRGAFGSHLANVFRRLNRICAFYKTSPHFFCSSATIANPVELAENITDHKFILIDKDGSPAPEKDYYFIQPPEYNHSSDSDPVNRKPVTSVAKELIPELVVQGHSFIAFCKSRKAVEIVVKESKELLSAADPGVMNYSDLISGYRGGYKPEERKEIEQKMVSGALKGLVSTNALELGIDIGKVDTTIIIGFPGTRASFWQQSGRAGRSGKKSDTFLILDIGPVDQFLAAFPDWLFNGSTENAVINKNNLFIQLAHARAAAAELPLTLDDMSTFPSLGEIAPILMNAGEIKMDHGRFAWSGSNYPAGDFSLRNIDKERYKLIENTTGEHIEEFDTLQAFREIHKGSVYMHAGQSYLVTSFDKIDHCAYCESFGGNYFTEPFLENTSEPIRMQGKKPIFRTTAFWGDVSVTTIVKGHKKIQFHNHDNLGYETIDELSNTINTEGVYLAIPENVRKTLLQFRVKGFRDHMDGLAFALLNAAKALTMTDQSDIGVIIGLDPEKHESAILIHDLYIGGMGYSEKCFENYDYIIEHAIEQVKGCKCKNGCPACVGDHLMDKSLVLWGLENLIQETTAPADIASKTPPSLGLKYNPHSRTKEKKPFSIDTISEKWDEFRTFIRGTGEANSAFLSSSVSMIEISDGRITLVVDNMISALLVSDESNNQEIKNTLNYYIEMSAYPSFSTGRYQLDAKVSNPTNTIDRESLIARHYNVLTENK